MLYLLQSSLNKFVQTQGGYDLSSKIKCTFFVLFCLLLGGCATAGKMLMAGYQPPQTIADLLREQNELSAKSFNQDGKIYSSTQYNSVGSKEPRKRTNKVISLSDLENEQNYNHSGSFNDTPIRLPNSYAAQFTHKNIHDYASQLAMNLFRHINYLPRQSSIAVTSFVKLDHSLQNTTILGNQLAEYTLLELQKYGLNMVDHKLLPAIEVTNKGDLIFSRDIKKLARRQSMDYVLSATMIERYDGVFVNARIISMSTNRLAASGSVLIPQFIVSQVNPYIAAY